ncbi:MAG: hypothetical protein HW387_492 [Parachlamydiales bacterium]|nr:hypothetical protein [Parachlamydiales bacterium]
MKKIIAGLLLSSSLLAHPEGPTIVNGTAEITQTPNALEIFCSDDLIIHWDHFGIDCGETVTFIQPSLSSYVLNRIIGPESSRILGSLSSNGALFLINPNGILIGEKAQINVGSLVAATLDLTDADFLGRNFFFSGEEQNPIANFGTIASQGDVYLLSNNLNHQGTITASGKVGLGAGETIMIRPAEAISLYIIPSARSPSKHAIGLNVLGPIIGSQIEMKADGNLFELAINQAGKIDATAIVQDGGEIFLTTQTGSISIQNSQMSAHNDLCGGKIEVVGSDINIDGQVQINVSHAQDGGSIRIGSTGLTQSISIGAGTVLDASSTETGNGGRIIIDSDADAQFLGQAHCHGGLTRGDGGSVDITGFSLVFNGDVDTRASVGHAGNVQLVSSQTAIVADLPLPHLFPDASVIQVQKLNRALAGGHVSISVKQGFDKDIYVLNDIVWSANNTLTLSADRKISFDASIDNGLPSYNHQSLTVSAREIDINAVINAGNNTISCSIGNGYDGSMTIAYPIYGSRVLIQGGDQSNQFNISCDPFACNFFIDGGAISPDTIKTLRNNNFSSSWDISGVNSGRLGLIGFANINIIEGFTGDCFSITGQVDQLMLKSGSSVIMRGGQILDIEIQGSSKLEIAGGMVSVMNANGGENVFQIDGGVVCDIFCSEGSNTFYLSSGDVTHSIRSANANDYFYLSKGGSITGSIDGGLGVNELNYQNYGSAIEVDFSSGTATGIGGGIYRINSVAGDASHFGRIIIPDDAAECTVDSDFSGNINGNEIAFSQISALGTKNDENTFHINGAMGQISGGKNNVYHFHAQADVLDYVEGGSLSNIYYFCDGAHLQGTIIGNGPDNELNFQNYQGPVDIDLGLFSGPGILGGFSNIQRFVGNSLYRGSLKGNNEANTWLIDGAHSGAINGNIFFSNFDHLIAGDGNDTVQLNPGGMIRIVEGGLGKNQYYINGGEVEEKIQGQGMEETFIFTHAHSIQGNISGGARGTNVLDYSSYELDVFVDFSTMRATGFSGTFSNINQVIGNGDTRQTTVKGSHVDSRWEIHRTSGATWLGSNFVELFQVNNVEAGDRQNDIYFRDGGSIQSFTGGLGTNNFYFQKGDVTRQVISKGRKDQLIFENGAQIAGSVIGQGGYTVLNYENYQSAITVDLQNSTATGIGQTCSNIFEIVGDQKNGGTLIGKDEESRWEITGNHSGSVNQWRFSNIDHISCGQSANVIYFNPGARLRTIEGVAGQQNILDYSNYGRPITLDLQNRVITGVNSSMAHISHIRASAQFDNTILGSDLNTTWNINGAWSGEVIDNQTTLFSHFSILWGGWGTNTFNLASAISIIRGQGNNTYNIYPGAAVDSITGGSLNDRFFLFDQVRLSALFDASDGGAKELNFSNYHGYVEVDLQSRATSAGMTIRNFNQIVGDATQFGCLAGPNGSNIWKLDGPNAGVINDTIVFSNFSDLKGHGAQDRFQFFPAGGISGHLDGTGTTQLTLDFTSFSSAVICDLEQNQVTGIGGTWSNVGKVIACPSQDNVLTGPNQMAVWEMNQEGLNQINYDNKQISCSHFFRLKGGSKENTFNISSESDSDIIGGAGNNIFNLNSGFVDRMAGGGSNTFNIDSGADVKTQIIAGDGCNTFNMMNGGAITGTVDFGLTGTSRLNYQNYGSFVEIDFVNHQASGFSAIINAASITQVIGDQSNYGRISVCPNCLWNITGSRSGQLHSMLYFTNISELAGEDYHVHLEN